MTFRWIHSYDDLSETEQSAARKEVEVALDAGMNPDQKQLITNL